MHYRTEAMAIARGIQVKVRLNNANLWTLESCKIGDQYWDWKLRHKNIVLFQGLDGHYLVLIYVDGIHHNSGYEYQHPQKAVDAAVEHARQYVQKMNEALDNLRDILVHTVTVVVNNNGRTEIHEVNVEHKDQVWDKINERCDDCDEWDIVCIYKGSLEQL